MSKRVSQEEDGKVSKFKFLEMYNPFVPASRTTTPPPPPPTDAPFEETLLPAILGVVCVLLMAFAVVTLVVNHYLKFLPFHRGRSLSLPSVEFDVEEILAALEWEKRSGERREQSATLDRNIIERGSDELVAVIASVPSCSETIKSHKIVPEKPKRQHANDPKKPKSDVRGYTDDKMKKSRVTKEPKRKKSLAENQGSTTAAKKEAKEDETDDKSLTEQTPVEGYVDALDKIKKSHFPKVLPDFPFEHIDYEGDSTHEKRMMNRPPPNLENLTRKITPPSPPKVPIIFTASKDKSRNVVPNFLSLHTNLSSPETNTGDSLGQTSTQVISSKKLIKNKDDHRLISENKSETINEDKIPHKTSKKRLKEKSTLEDETGIIDKDDFKVKDSKEYSKEDLVLLREGSSKNYDSSNDVIPKSENFNNQNDILETPFEKYDDHAAGTPLSECSKTAENIASVIKYLEEQEELEGSSDTADQTKKEVLKTKPNDDSHVTTANAPSSEASDGKNEDETESILQSDSSYTEIKDNIPDSPTDRANKSMLKNIINAFENNTTNILTGEATTIEGEAKAMPLKLSAKRKQFGKKLESILKGQISPGQIPYHSAKDSNIDLIEDTPNAEKLCSPEKNEEVKNNQKDSESNSSQPEECSSIGSRGSELNISDEANRDVEEEGDFPGNTILISPGGSTFQEIEYIDQVKSCSIDMESESELKKEEIVQNDHVKAPHDENDYQDHTFSPSTNSRGIKKSVSEGETKATIDYHSFRKCKSSDYPDMGKSHEQGLPPTPDHIKLSISDDSTIAANIAKTIFDITQSSNDLKSPDLSDDDSTLHTGERISKKILASIENDGLPTSSNMLSSKISSPDKHSKRASKSPDENTPEESIINNELINLLYSPRDSNEGNSTGLIDRPRSDLGKLYKSKDEGNTGWSQGRKTSSV